MKVLLVLVAALFVAVDALKCPPVIWGCKKILKKNSYSSKHHHSKVKLRVQRDESAPRWRMLEHGDGVPCLTDDSECRSKIQELWERVREETMYDKEKKRQLDCPFGVWACKKRQVIGKEKPAKRNCAPGDRECQRDDGEMNDFIEELFTES
jgi:hypothetical protein